MTPDELMTLTCVGDNERIGITIGLIQYRDMLIGRYVMRKTGWVEVSNCDFLSMETEIFFR